jgi:cell division protein FtsZ
VVEPQAEPEAEPLDLGAMSEVSSDAAGEGYSYGADEDYDEDVEGIVDPLAGLRNDNPQGYGEDDEGPSAEDEEDDWGDPLQNRPAKQPLDLGGMAESGGEEPGAEPRAAQDELLLDADRLAEQDSPLQSKAGRRRGLVSGGGGGGASSAGSTLFERMANLSRGASSADDETDEDDEEGESSASLSIPRFLGRQNNQ